MYQMVSFLVVVIFLWLVWCNYSMAGRINK